MSESLSTMFMNIPWFAWIPIVAIICGALVNIVKMQHSHVERMEKIRQGIDPDGGKPAQVREI